MTNSTTVIDQNQFVKIDSIKASYEYRDTPPPLTNGGSYAYRVISVLSTGTRAQSTIAYVYIMPPTPAETFRLSGYLDSSKIARLQWIAPANVTVAKYYVYRMTVSSTGAPFEMEHSTLIDSTTSLITSDTSTKNATGTFIYLVRAKSSSGKYISSNSLVMTLSTQPVLQYIKLSGALNDSGKVQLTWEISSGAAFTKYYIYRALYDPRIMTFAPIALFIIDSTTQRQYVDNKLSNTSYGFTYQVHGKTTDREIISNSISLMTLDQVTLTAYTDFDGVSVKLNWTKPASSAIRYYILYRNLVDQTGKVDSTRWVVVDTIQKNEYSDHPTDSASIFLYFVRAVLTDGKVVTSNVVSVPWRLLVVKPFTLSGHSTNNGGVELSWNDAVPFTVSKYYLYRATLPRGAMRVDSLTQFSLVDSTRDWSIKNSPPLSQSNAFAYYVEARGVSQKKQTNYFAIIINSASAVDRVTIISQPPHDGHVGLSYTYQARAISSDSTASMRWTLGKHPTGMAIDSATGLIAWVPAMKGWFDASITVYSSKGGKASQEFDIAIAGAYGFVRGTVLDTLGNPLYAAVKLLKRDNTHSFEYRAVSDSAGHYEFNSVDVGSYIAYAAPIRGNYMPQWYYQKKSSAQATPIIVADSSTSIVDFVMQSRAAVLPFFNTSGSVIDTLGRKITGAVVVFTKSEFMLNSSKNSNSSDNFTEDLRDMFSINPQFGSSSSALQNESPMVFHAVTDTAGKYSLRIPQGNYIGLAFAQGYRKMFYNGQTDLLSADILRLSKDTTSINFSLKPIPAVALGSISGTITDTSGTVTVQARIVVYRDKRGTVESYFNDSDTTGEYTVDELPPGDYFVLAVPLGHYAPSFYSVTGPTMRWKQATKVTINGTSVSGIDIMVKPLIWTASGYTSILGTVTSTSPSGSIHLSKMSTTSTGINGSLIYATDASGNIAGYGVSEADGSYTISALSPQTYSVIADRFGYESSLSSTVTPSYDIFGNSQPATASFTMNSTPTDVDVISTVIPTEFSLSQNYPNPFNPTTQISFRLPATERIVLRIYNILGQEVSTLVNEVVAAGVHTVAWDGKNNNGISLSSGVYFYQLKGTSSNAIRKMVLLK